MKKITCKKPCNIGGMRFTIGDDVPAELIAPGREAALVGYGLISVENFPEFPSTPVPNGSPDSGENDGDDEQKEPEQTTPTATGTRSEKKNGKKVKE